MKKEIEKLTGDFFEKMKVNIDKIEVEEEKEGNFYVKIKTEESSFIIGTHGKNLEDITNILRLVLIKKLGLENKIIHLEVNDYLESKDNKLFKFTESKIRLVEKFGKEVQLPFLTSYERKKVHSFVSGLNSNLFTKSVGEGKDRRMFIGKNEEKAVMDIDIDGSDI